MTRFAAVLGLLLLAASSASAQDAGVPGPPPPPSVRAMPAVPAALAADFAQPRALFGALMRLRAPRMTDAVDPQKLQRRLRETLVPWVQQRITATASLETALAPLASRSLQHRAIGAAMIALAYDDFASQFGRIDAPRTLRGDPQMRAMWHSVIVSQGDPFRARALDAWRACAAVEDPVVAPWRAFCAARLAQLDPAAADAGIPDDAGPPPH